MEPPEVMLNVRGSGTKPPANESVWFAGSVKSSWSAGCVSGVPKFDSQPPKTLSPRSHASPAPFPAWSTSNPGTPLSVSFPPPPLSVSSPSFPLRVSLPPPPLSLSLPGPPLSVSSPLLPQMRSFPPRPLTVSLPPPAHMTSSPPVPLIVSPAAVPVIVGAIPKQAPALASVAPDAPGVTATTAINTATTANSTLIRLLTLNLPQQQEAPVPPRKCLAPVNIPGRERPSVGDDAVPGFRPEQQLAGDKRDSCGQRAAGSG